MKTKTVKEYLEWIPDQEIREKALRNMWSDRQNDYCNSLEHAIFVGFLWFKSPEGYDYWKKIHAGFNKGLHTQLFL